LKRVPGLRDLSDDHHEGLVLARRCKLAARGETVTTLASALADVRSAFASHLDGHFEIEEQMLLPELEALGEVALAVRIREEHCALRALQSDQVVSRESLLRFGELLESHIRFEERQVFETTQNRLPARALEAIARACRDRPRPR
jgi:hemerythrin-like domain-containing protein